ncbi:hypothetical protein F4776DRAFT_661831 [Hypoxylon sp. NC0597]|nr:hypothetical protein F4776DRAFT_661831 [Hypoxylon sp. NC0597]
MATRHIALLALAGSAFAQMSSMESGAMSLTDISPTTTTTSVSQLTDSSAGMSDSSSMATDSGSVMSTTTESSMWTSVSSSENAGETTSMSMESSMSGSTMIDMSSMTTDIATPTGTPMSTGGVASNATGVVETSGQGASVINAVSVGLFVISMALTAMIQL